MFVWSAIDKRILNLMVIVILTFITFMWTFWIFHHEVEFDIIVTVIFIRVGASIFLLKIILYLGQK